MAWAGAHVIVGAALRLDLHGQEPTSRVDCQKVTPAAECGRSRPWHRRRAERKPQIGGHAVHDPLLGTDATRTCGSCVAFPSLRAKPTTLSPENARSAPDPLQTESELSESFLGAGPSRCCQSHPLRLRRTLGPRPPAFGPLECASSRDFQPYRGNIRPGRMTLLILSNARRCPSPAGRMT